MLNFTIFNNLNILPHSGFTNKLLLKEDIARNSQSDIAAGILSG